MVRFFFRKEQTFTKDDILGMYHKKNVRGLIRALTDTTTNPEVREEAVDRLKWLVEDKSKLSVEEIIKYDLVRALMPMLNDENLGVCVSTSIFYSNVLERLQGASNSASLDYLIRIALETRPDEADKVRNLRRDCAVNVELAYDSARRYSCASCGVNWDRSKMDMFFPRYALVMGISSPSVSDSKQPAGRCPTCKNYYCASCASMKPPWVLCPKCNQSLTWETETKHDIEMRLLCKDWQKIFVEDLRLAGKYSQFRE